jgi:hypothetical protein
LWDLASGIQAPWLSGPGSGELCFNEVYETKHAQVALLWAENATLQGSQKPLSDSTRVPKHPSRLLLATPDQASPLLLDLSMLRSLCVGNKPKIKYFSTLGVFIFFFTTNIQEVMLP